MILPLQKSHETIIDDDDYERISQFHWWFDGRYVVTEKRYGLRILNKKKKTYLHRFLLGLQSGRNPVVDHIDSNRLNNQKSNLRICTQVENQQNRRISKNNTSGVNGVMWFKPAKLWLATGVYRGKRVWFKYFKTFEEAIESRKEFEKLYFSTT